MFKQILYSIKGFLAPISVLLFLIIIIFSVSLLRKTNRNDISSTSQPSSLSESEETESESGEEVSEVDEESSETSEEESNESYLYKEETKIDKSENTPNESAPSMEEENIKPVNQDMIYLATDIHYYISELTDYKEAFTDYMNRDDGKDIKDVERTLDEWIEIVKRDRPAVVIISGDNTLNGEKRAHEELVKKLLTLKDDGITVLTVPGNHDINNPNSAEYFNDQRKFTTNILTAEEFYEIYKELGYDQSFSRDENSLSYAYRYEDGRIILMLDSAVYEPSNKVYGTIKKETLEWMEKILKEAGDAQVIVSAHHNLLSESRLYTSEVTLTNNGEVIDLLKKYNVNLYLSGHLHLQRIREYKSEPGVKEKNSLFEAVTGSFAMYPFPYGKILWNDENIIYTRECVDSDKDLVQSGKEEFERVYAVKIGGKIRNVPQYMIEGIYKSYTNLIMSYVSGEIFDEKSFRESKEYSYILRLIPESDTNEEIEKMLKDTKIDNTYLEIETRKMAETQAK